MAVGTTAFPLALDTATELIQVANGASSTIGTGGVTSGATTVPITDTSTFPSSGVIWVGSEAISYTGKTSTTITGCVRGFDGTTAASHAAGDIVFGDIITSAHHEALRGAIIALETEALRNPVPLVGLTTDGTGDNTTTINAQLTALAATRGASTGGATAVLPAGTIMVSNITVPNHVRLVGQGIGTVLRAVTGTTGAMIALAANHNRFVGIEDLRVDGNSQTVTGISIDTQDVTTDEYGDGMPTVKNVFVHNCGVDGLYVTGRGEGFYQRIRIRDCTRYGVNCDGGVDNDFTNVMVGGSGSAGFRVTASNNRWSNCKSFYSGLITYASGHGFWCDGSAGGHTNTFANCEAQDNVGHGFYVDTFDKAQLLACVADSNNAGHNAAPDQNADGFRFNNSSYGYVNGIAFDRNANTRRQNYGLGLSNGVPYLNAAIRSIGNISGHVRNGWHENVTIAVNGYGNLRSVSYAATLTPDPTTGSIINLGALTGGITINAPASGNTWTGQEMDFIITQDATGGRVVTWNAAYLVSIPPTLTPSATSIMRFVYNGTNWIQVAGDPKRIVSASLLSTPAAGMMENDGNGFFFTVDTTNGRADDNIQQVFKLTADGSAIGPTIADFFGANSAIPLVAGATYEITWYCWYTKTTTGTVTYTITHSVAPTRTKAFYQQSAASGIASIATLAGGGATATTSTAVALPVTSAITSGVTQYAEVRAIVVANTAGNVRLRVTESAGTITPLADSYFTVRRLPSNTGTFAA